jgi:hypothetical protein
MSIPFPEGPADKDVFFHKETVCIYHQEKNVWECRRITPQDVNYRVLKKLQRS